MKVLIILKARLEFIIVAIVSRKFEKNDKIKEIIVHIGQQYE